MKISVITVVYNCVNTIEYTIESVLSQSYSNIEYIIIDGGSTDGTVEIIQKKNKDNSILFISENDNGIYDAMNKGIRLATGEYLCFLNSGDSFYDDEVVRKIISKIKNEPYDIIYGDIVDKYSEFSYSLLKQNKKINDIFFLKGMGICHQSIFARSNTLKESLFDTRYKLCADRDWLIKSYKKGYSFKYLKSKIAYYDRNGISSNCRNRKYLSEEVRQILISYYGNRARIVYFLKDLKNRMRGNEKKINQNDFIKSNIIYSPYSNCSNEYSNIMMSFIKEAGMGVFSFKSGLTKLNKINFLFLNWIENTKYHNILFVHIEYKIKKIAICMFKFIGIKVIWVVHNKLPHNTLYQNISKEFIKFLVIKSNAIVIHSKATVNYLTEFGCLDSSKVYYLPHPNYIDVYGSIEVDFRDLYKIPENYLVFLFFGAVSGYKNIELLIESFEELNLEKAKLIIVGSPSSPEYKQYLTDKIKKYGSNKIIYDFRFVENSELASLIQSCDITVFPYNTNSSLNSGAVYLSFSLHKTVISSEIGTIKDLANEDFYYSYDYIDKNEHKCNLKMTIKNVYNDFISDENALKSKGQRAFDYVELNHSSDEIITKLVEMINDITY